MAWTAQDSGNLFSLIKSLDPMNEVKYVMTDRSTLGGEDNASIFIRISLDERSEWINTIFHNSRFAIFSLNGNKLELIAKHHEMPKFRKATIKNENLLNVAERIVNYAHGAA